MKKFTIQCSFSGKIAPFDVFIGMPKDGSHPLQNQAKWLSTQRGGQIPPNAMECFANILKKAKEQGVEFEELCMFAFQEKEKKEQQDAAKNQITDKSIGGTKSLPSE